MPDFLSFPFENYDIDVSRETREKFSRYDALLLKWQRAINLVSPDSIEDRIIRHFIDSAQIFKKIHPLSGKIVDLGSGAGFPGMVLAMMGLKDIHLVDSDVRKSTFLREVSRETKTPVTIHDKRAEDLLIRQANVFTARALAPLTQLFSMVKSISGNEISSVTCFFLKGEKAEDEVKKAEKRWKFSLEILPSVTDKSGKILKINKLDYLL